jgi:hypothetical protein
LKITAKTDRKRKWQATAANERFGAMSALPRRQFCGKLNVTTPQQVQWRPPLRQAAGTLYASGRQRGGQRSVEMNIKRQRIYEQSN